MDFSAAQILPADAERATLIGRAWVPGRIGGPSPVVIAGGKVYDLARVAPTVSELLNSRSPVRMARQSVKSGWERDGRGVRYDSNSHADGAIRESIPARAMRLQALRAAA